MHKTINQQQQNHCLRPYSSLSYQGGGLNASYWRQIFTLDSVVINTQKLVGHKYSIWPTKCRLCENDKTLIRVWFSKKKSRAAKKSDGYTSGVIVPHTESYAWKYSKYDVVFEIYHQDSLKSETQQKRRTMLAKKAGNIRLSKLWNNFFRWDKANAEIFGFLTLKTILAKTKAQIIFTNGDGIVWK